MEASALPRSAALLSDASVLAALAEVSSLVNDAARVQAVLAGVAAQRSQRDDGHGGLAATQGHATPASLIQSITGGTRADANRQVRVGTALIDGDPVDDGGVPDSARPMEWHQPLRRALLDGTLTSEQVDAIRHGLGDPPPPSGGETAESISQAWTLAVEDLMADAPGMTVEDLLRRARIMRDLLDSVGAEQRCERRYEKRSYRRWIDRDGQRRATIAFDDEMGLWMDALSDSALRPRRGGPRFVADDERRAADELSADARTNEQLDYDLMMDVWLAGAHATAADVFGARQPGVRMVVVKDAVGPRDPLGRLTVVGHAEDGGDALPGSIIDRALCMHGSVDVVVDSCGNPLDLGREQRLYSPKQRVALAMRDGGCLWPGCSRNASYCEAHHCDRFVADQGRTDIDRGVLLCRFHHMLLHNRGWRITRDGKTAFMLHPPPGEGDAIPLRSKAAWQYAWDPPPPPARSGWRTAPARVA